MFSTAVYAGNIVKADSLKVTPTFREFFADVHLQHLVEQAVDSNLDLRNARLKIVEAQATLGNARNALLPKVTFDANGDIQRFGDSSLKTYKIGCNDKHPLNKTCCSFSKLEEVMDMYVREKVNVKTIEESIIKK